jgi:hypothetical protein
MMNVGPKLLLWRKKKEVISRPAGSSGNRWLTLDTPVPPLHLGKPCEGSTYLLISDRVVLIFLA